MSFATEARAYAERTKLAMKAVVGQSLGELSRNVIDDTPVDTGRLKGNWQATLGQKSNKSLLTTDKEGSATKFLAEVVADDAAGKFFFLTNNVEYGYNIEFNGGSPRKAPAGMVGINVVRFPAIWDAAIARNRT